MRRFGLENLGREVLHVAELELDQLEHVLDRLADGC
jgi:hypothetical protein